MSTTATKRRHFQALQDAQAFRNLLPKQFWERWEFAGSLRRNRPEVGDVEHVVIPVMSATSQSGLFAASPLDHNTLWDRVEELVQMGTFSKHVYQTTRGDQFRWGEKYRGIDFRGFNHEIFIADALNWGSVLAIRTGPGEFSQRLVVGLKKQGLVNRGGYVRNPSHWDCPRCHMVYGEEITANPQQVGQFIDGVIPGLACDRCGDTMLAQVVPCPSEAEFFEMAGMPMLPPERRMP